MKKTRTLLSIFWAVVIAVAVFVIPAIATETDTPNESVVFNITTDKEEINIGQIFLPAVKIPGNIKIH